MTYPVLGQAAHELEAGSRKPQLAVSLPACLTSRPEAVACAAGRLAFYAGLPSYRNMLDTSRPTPVDIAIIGGEHHVEQQLHAVPTLVPPTSRQTSAASPPSVNDGAPSRSSANSLTVRRAQGGVHADRRDDDGDVHAANLDSRGAGQA